MPVVLFTVTKVQDGNKGGVDTLLKLRNIHPTRLVTRFSFIKHNCNIISNIMGIDSPQLKKRRMSVSDSADNDASAPTLQLLVKRLSDKAKIPTRGSNLAAGYDLYR